MWQNKNKNKYLLTEFGWAGQENIWLSVMAHGPHCSQSIHYDFNPNIFLSGPPTQSLSTYYVITVQCRQNCEGAAVKGNLNLIIFLLYVIIKLVSDTCRITLA